MADDEVAFLITLLEVEGRWHGVERLEGECEVCVEEVFQKPFCRF